MRKLFLTMVMAVSCLAMAVARPVTPERAQEMAMNFWAQNNQSATELVNISDEMGFQNIYVFTTGDRLGFVIMSADDCALPIIGYSFESPIRTDSLPQNLQNWLKGRGDEIAWIAKHSTEQSAKVAKEWAALESQGDVAGRVSTERSNVPARVNVVSALLTTTWNQGAYYNKQCPSDSYGKCYTGCTATATAQVMKYHNWPTRGHGSHSYSWNSTTLSADFDTVYAWANMPNSLGSSSTTTQDNAVALLMYHVGVGCEMDYSSSGSGASAIAYNRPSYASAENALRDYFKYDWGIHSVEMEYFTDEQWRNLLKADLNDSMPVIYTGFDQSSGHCFVCDGYNSSEEFHFNWGWGGYADGYFAIGHLDPMGSGAGGSTSGTYNLNNQAVLGIKPNQNEGASSTLSYTVNNAQYGSVSVESGRTNMTSYSTVTELLANANEGYRFTGWADGCIYNPRKFKGNGGTLNVTANFEPCGGDTAYYCHDNGYYYYDNPTEWAIRIPAAQLRANDTLKSVMFYLLEDGSYTIKVYTGGTSSPTTLQTSQTVNLTDAGWKTVPLTTPVAANTSLPMWIAVSCSTSGYNAAISHYAGNGDSNWYKKANGTWKTLTQDDDLYSYMIKGIFYTDPNSVCTLTGNVYPAGAGNVDGAGQYNKGTEATIYALAQPGYKFVGWEDGGMDQPRTVIMNGSKNVTAYYEPIAGDTLTYSVDDEYLNAIGTSTNYTIYWAVKFDTAALTPDRQIKAVQLYDVSSSSTGMYIYQGGAKAPGTLKKSYASITTTDAERYNTYNLPSAYHIDATQPLWIVFKCSSSSSHPCAYTHYSGNNNGCYLSLGDNNSWESLTESEFYGSWMIKVITEEDDGTGVEELGATVCGVYSEGTRVIVGGDDVREVRIYDTTGKLIATGAEREYVMPVAGVYYVVVNGTQATKIVVK